MRVLVDTSVWSRHLRVGAPGLEGLLRGGRVVVHPWVIGELTLGPGVRGGFLTDLGRLRGLPVVDTEALLDFVRLHTLRGIGWVDAQLLYSALQANVALWTDDRGLHHAAERFGRAWSADG